MPSDELAARVDRLPPTAFVGRAFRHLAKPYDPLSGRGARINGGRWNPADSFAVLYLGLDERTVALEFERLAARQGRAISDFLPRWLYAYGVDVKNALDLREEVQLDSVGLTMAEVADDDLRACQVVGEAAQHAGREGVLAPSAAGSGSVLAVFIDSIAAGSSVHPRALRSWATPGDLA